jgi:hypothetical protein
MSAACQFCGGTSNGYECDWPVERFVPTPLPLVKVGDEVRKASAKKSQGIARVDAVRVLEFLGIVFVRLLIVWPWKTQTRRFKEPADNTMLVKRVIVCGTPVCDACMIERDPEKMVLCRDHWHAWESVA